MITKPDPKNPNRLADDDRSRLRKSLAEFGDLSGIVINERTGLLIGGHQRVNVMGDGSYNLTRSEVKESDGTVATGYTVIDDKKFNVRVVDWDETKAHAAMLAANRFGRVGEDDVNLVKELLLEINSKNIDMDLTGYSFVDSEKITKQADSEELGDVQRMSLQPFEKHDYIMLLFDNDQEFSNACERLEIKKVQIIYNAKCSKVGLGRVVSGATVLKKLFVQ